MPSTAKLQKSTRAKRAVLEPPPVETWWLPAAGDVTHLGTPFGRSSQARFSAEKAFDDTHGPGGGYYQAWNGGRRYPALNVRIGIIFPRPVRIRRLRYYPQYFTTVKNRPPPTSFMLEFTDGDNERGPWEAGMKYTVGNIAGGSGKADELRKFIELEFDFGARRGFCIRNLNASFPLPQFPWRVSEMAMYER